MSVTATKIAGPAPLGGLGLFAVYKCLLDTSFLATGEPIDLTGHFSSLYAAWPAGVNAIADALYSYGVVLPDDGTDIAAGTVLISAIESPAKTGATEAAEAFAAVSSTDLHSVGELRIAVIGKAL